MALSDNGIYQILTDYNKAAKDNKQAGISAGRYNSEDEYKKWLTGMMSGILNRDVPGTMPSSEVTRRLDEIMRDVQTSQEESEVYSGFATPNYYKKRLAAALFADSPDSGFFDQFMASELDQINKRKL